VLLGGGGRGRNVWPGEWYLEIRSKENRNEGADLGRRVKGETSVSCREKVAS